VSFSASNTELWSAILQFAIISVFMICANILRRKIPIVNKSLLPVAVIAGFLLLFAKELNLIPVDGTFMESLTYHATGIGFIALGLRVPRKKELESESDTAKSFGLKSGMIIVSTYLLQACIGLVITIILGFTVMPNLFKACGILLPLGFGQGPGQAYNIGTSYQTSDLSAALLSGLQLHPWDSFGQVSAVRCIWSVW
jgi:ESS family glutamate:Na+ symporter